MSLSFNWNNPVNVIFGSGKIKLLGEEIKKYGASKVLLITDAGLKKAGVVDNILEHIPADIKCETYTDVIPEPPMESIAQCAGRVKEGGFELLIGLGGGSSIDVTKVVAVMATNEKSLPELCGVDNVEKPGLPTIMIPTTAGTGSEVTPIAIVTNEKEHLKVGIVSSHLFAKTALLDPVLTVPMPPRVTAATGMDALTHAIEAFISVNATPMSDVLALEAVKVISRSLRKAFANGEDIEAREDMHYGSLLAGMAFANAGVGAVHALAYPLGGEYNIPHGVANALLLPYVLDSNMIACLERLALIGETMGVVPKGASLKEKAMQAVAAVDDLSSDVEIPRSLKEVDIPADALEKLAAAATKVTRLLANNPRRLSEDKILEIYKMAYEG